MSIRAEKAVEYKYNQNNCAQAVLLAFSDELGKDETELKALGSGFGMGMGCLEGTCGALCAAGMVLGLLNKQATPTKMLMKTVLQEFKAQAGATICGDLKGMNNAGKALCDCDDCIRHAVVALEKQL